ncbi:hypothetical protein BKA69DRAFT_1079017 [Paraphysoderma sedebokerense]|nr:hypothetical protein BKA69DRAFT_1079017 [Paraphysoderma sedebokerense]
MSADKVIASRTDWDFQYFSPEIIKGVIVTILKHGYAEPSSMLLLTRVVTCIYRHLLNQPLSSVRLIEMTLSHSQFLPLIINLDAITSAPPEVASRVKTAVIYFLYTLIKIDPIEHCKPEFVPSLLSAYSATLAPSDQLIFEILTLYESSMSLSRSTLLWGPSSFHLRRQLQLDSSTPKFLVSINTVIESISQLDSTWLAHTVRQFPTQISLQSPIHGLARVVENFLKGDLVANKPIYDPRYMLPLFVGYMKFGSQVDARKYIEMNAVGLAVAALSSADQSMRRLGYIVLDEYFSLFETSSFREKPQIQLLLNSVKNSIADRNTPQRLPSMISTFIAQALSILLKPDHLMYSNINRFLLQRPILDLEDIPMFYSLIHSSSQQFSKERLWMMRLLACGLKDSMDLQLYKRRHAWDIICSYFDSTLVDGLTKKIALEIVGKITTIPTALHDLMLHHGLLPWLHHITSSVACSNFKLADVTSILLLTRIFRRVSVVILSPINDNYTSDGTPRWKHQTTYIHQISLILLSCLKQLKGLMPVIGRNEDTTAILWNIVYEVSKLLRLAVEYEVPPTANVREGIEAPHVILQPLTLQLISIFRDLVNASLYTEGSDFKQDHLIRLAQVSDDKVSTSLEFITLSSQSDLLEILCFVDPDILKIQKFAVETLCYFIISIHADDSLGHRRAYNDDVNWILNWGWSKFELEKVAEWLCEVDT